MSLFNWLHYPAHYNFGLLLFLAIVCIVLLIRGAYSRYLSLKRIPSQSILDRCRIYTSPLSIDQIWFQLGTKKKTDLFRSYELVDWGDDFSKSIFLDIESFQKDRSLYNPWVFVPIKRLNWFIDCSIDTNTNQSIVKITWNGSSHLFSLFGKFFIDYTDQFLEQKILASPKISHL